MHTLFDSGSASSLLRSLLKESSSDSPNNVIGSPRSLNLRITSFLDNVCFSEVALLLSSPLPNNSFSKIMFRYDIFYIPQNITTNT